MTTFYTVVVLTVAIFAEYVIEVAAELSSDMMLDAEVGAVVELAPGPVSDVVDTMPQATVRWSR